MNSETKKSRTLESAMKTLDKLADSFGVVRATHISMLAKYLVALEAEFKDMLKELDELRKFKEEHTDNDDQCDEVQADS